MFEIGDNLREARIRKGLSIKDVEDGTKIRSKYLQALEEEDFEVIPGPTFVKGFMRTYADFLELDAGRFIEEYRSRYESQPNPHQIRSAERRSRPRSNEPRNKPNHVIVGVVTLAVIIVLVWVGWGRGSEPAELDPATVSEDTTETTLGDGGAEIAGGGGGTPGTDGIELDGSLPADAPGTATTEAAQTPETTGTTEGDEVAGSEGSLEVVAGADGGRCWLLVREGSAEGAVLFTGTLEPGDQQSFSTDGRLWMHVGSPAALELTVNGEAVDVPEPYGEFLITAEGVDRIS